jgi:choline dehydrogenase-like flavoprotein
VLAAGGVHSSKLLQLSGIGDKRLLDRLEIPVVVDLPGVGENYQDHASVSAQYSSKSIAPIK